MSIEKVECGACEQNDEARPSWGPGPWSAEPENRVEFRHAGFPCILHRGGLGAWCGYVGVPPGHPWYDQNYSEIGAQVHGGLTYGEHCGGHICHVPELGEPEEVYWLGFDCAHAGDQPPGMTAFDYKHGLPGITGQVYRTVEYARAETEQLAEQAAAATEHPA